MIRIVHSNPTTYAVETVFHNGEEIVHVIAAAKANVEKGDEFCKKLGRIKATGRLKSERYRTYPDDIVLFKDFAKNIRMKANDASCNKGCCKK